MNVEEAIYALLTVASVVFSDDTESKIDPEVNSKNLKQVLENVLQNRGVPLDTLMRNKGRPSSDCKVYAASQNGVFHSLMHLSAFLHRRIFQY